MNRAQLFEQGGKRPTTDRGIAELNGYLELGMKSQALHLARRLLNDPTVTAVRFSSAMDAILVQADRPRVWRPLVEQALDRVPKSQRHRVRSKLFGFYVCLDDWASAARYIPARANRGRCGAVEIRAGAARSVAVLSN